MDVPFILMAILSNHQLRSHPEIYEGYVPMEYGDYLKKMSKYWRNPFLLVKYKEFWVQYVDSIILQFGYARSGEWGDHVTLQAAADSVGTIMILSHFFPFWFYENEMHDLVIETQLSPKIILGVPTRLSALSLDYMTFVLWRTGSCLTWPLNNACAMVLHIVPLFKLSFENVFEVCLKLCFAILILKYWCVFVPF